MALSLRLTLVLALTSSSRSPPPSPHVRLQGVGLASYHPLQVTSAVIGTSVSKMFALATESPPLLAVLIVIAIFFALVNVISLILAAKAVDQAPAPTSRST